MDIAAANKRCEAASPGPWEFTTGFYGWDSGIFPVGCKDKLNQSIFANNGHANGDPTEADAEFCAHARTDLPAALEALEEAQAFRAELEDLVDGDDSTLADQIRDLILNLDEGILRGSKEDE